MRESMEETSKKLLAEFYKTHPIIHAQDWMSQKQAVEFLGDDYKTNRMRLWRSEKKRIVHRFNLCNMRILYLRQEIENMVQQIEKKAGTFDALKFEKKKLSAVKYIASTKDFIPRCWLEELTEGYYKERTKYYLSSRLDYPLIRSIKVFHMRWFNVEDIIYYIVEGKGTPIYKDVEPLGLGFSMERLEGIANR